MDLLGVPFPIFDVAIPGGDTCGLVLIPATSAGIVNLHSLETLDLAVDA